MRQPLRVAVMALVSVGLATVALAATQPRHRGASAAVTWRRVLHEDFSHGLSSRRWGRYAGVPGGDPGGLWAESHAFVRRGVLNLASYPDPRHHGRWVSGGVSSAPAVTQTYGRYEVRLRVDGGRGIAFVALLWPSGNSWPPEVDFAENGGETRGRDHMSATLHFGVHDSQIQRTVRADFTRWHVVGVEWTPASLVYTLDGHPWASIRSRAVPAQPMELDLQTQAGTCGDRFAPCPDASTPRRVNAQIDWVDVYAYHHK